MMTESREPALSVKGLRSEIEQDGRWLPVVEGVSFDVRPGEVLGLVGESGSGKSVTAMTLMGLMGRSRGQRSSGSALLHGKELIGMPTSELRKIRGKEMAMIFQDPMTSLDPAFRVGEQIAAGVRIHQRVSKAEARRIAIDAMDKVRIPNARARADNYPHEFSGGMRQRVLIAMAIANNPAILIADEPTTALDVSVQAQILNLLADMQGELGMGMVFITHSMGVVAQLCDRVAVMYAGQIVEQGDVYEIFANAQHPYTSRLLASMPSIETKRGRLEWIPGTPPRASEFVDGCRFAPRCQYRTEICDSTTTLVEIGPERWNRCSRGTEWKAEVAS